MNKQVLNLRVLGSIPVPPFPGWVMLGLPSHHSEPQFPLLENGDNSHH